MSTIPYLEEPWRGPQSYALYLKEEIGPSEAEMNPLSLYPCLFPGVGSGRCSLKKRKLLTLYWGIAS